MPHIGAALKTWPGQLPVNCMLQLASDQERLSIMRVAGPVATVRLSFKMPHALTQ